MYERNAVVLERYFDQMFGYNMKNNIKTNFNDYCELIDCLEKFQNISEEEETVIQEYDSIANKIREIQKMQENLNRRNVTLQEERESILQNVGENAETIQRRLDNVNGNIQKLNEEIKENAQNFVNVVAEFNEKSVIRTECGKQRRAIEGEYNRKLNQTLDDYQDIDPELELKAKQFIEIETDEIEQEIKEKMKKNGEKEKTPFNLEVIAKAIALSIDIQKRETDILSNIYDKTNRLFTEIKGGAIRVSKHQKIIKDAKCKLELIAAIKEYLIQFLDNERLTAVNGEEEHTKLMVEACKNLDEDLVQINNLYSLLLREASKKIAKNSYEELFNYSYLTELEKKSEEFDKKIKQLNLPVTIINPNHWRIEGMQKIYDVFCKCVTEEYDRDLTMYLPHEEEPQEIEEPEPMEESFEEDFETQETVEDAPKEEVTEENTPKEEVTEEQAKAEIDRKIDIILGFGSQNASNNSWDDEEDDDVFDDDFEAKPSGEKEEPKENKKKENNFWDDNESIFGDEEENTKESQENKKDDIFGNFDEEPKEETTTEDDVNFDIWGNDISKKDDEKPAKEDDDDIWDGSEDDDFWNEKPKKKSNTWEDKFKEENNNLWDDDEDIFGSDDDDEDEDDDNDNIFDDDEKIFDDDDVEETDDDDDDEDDYDDDKKTKNKKIGRGKHRKEKKKKEKIDPKYEYEYDDEDEEDYDDDDEDEDEDVETDKKKKGFFGRFKK